MPLLFILFCSIAALAKPPTPWQVKFNAYVADLPKDATRLLERIDGCAHWGGEESYDEARKKQILRAMNKLRCESLESDKTKILFKYKNQPKVIDKINNFPVA